MTNVLPYEYMRFTILRPNPGRAYNTEDMGTPVSGAFLKVAGREFTSCPNGIIRVPLNLPMFGRPLIWGKGQEIYSHDGWSDYDPRITQLLFMGNAPMFHQAKEIVLSLSPKF